MRTGENFYATDEHGWTQMKPDDKRGQVSFKDIHKPDSPRNSPLRVPRFKEIPESDIDSNFPCLEQCIAATKIPADSALRRACFRDENGRRI
jgi:hypothetical protein